MKASILIWSCAWSALTLVPAHAAVTAEEAAKLKSELTPLGAERAGNKDGTIPAWTGGYTTAIAGDKPGGRRSDPFASDKVLYAITAANLAQHEDKLSDGVKALLKKYPTYRIDVYPTRRTASAPQYVYDNTARNAVRAKLDGHVPTGAYGGIPFPLPKSGLEAIWNHKLAWRGASWEADLTHYQLTANGKAIVVTEAKTRNQMPYYFKDGSLDGYDGNFWSINLVNSGPPIRAGEIIVGRQNVDEAQKSVAYVYLAGQRRVRKLPNSCCDTPTPASAGVTTFDELAVFSGKTDLFDWKLLGKKEILIPYNENRFLQAKESDIIKGQHLNPDHVRWELHRVWVVEARLLPGQRHQAPRSVYYLDEDTWVAALGDRWDANGQLWKTMWAFNYVMPDFPGAIQQTNGFYDLLSGQGFVSSVMNNKSFHHRATPRWPDTLFTGEGLSAQGVR